MLKGPNLSKTSLTETIKANLIAFFDNGFLQAGGFFNVNIPQSGAYGGYQHLLKSVEDPRYSSGCVWRAFHENWVWENNIGVSISGLFINNTFFPLYSGYYIDYVNGQVVFDNPVPASSVVKMEYSYKWIKVESSEEFPLLRIPQLSTFRSDIDFPDGSGQNAMLTEQLVQLPCVGIKVKQESKKPYQIGNGFYNRYKIKYYILGEDHYSVHQIVDIIANQEEKTIFGFDIDTLAAANKFPLDYRGDKNPSGVSYDVMVDFSGNGGYRTDRFSQGKIRLYGFDYTDTDRVGNFSDVHNINNLYYNIVNCFAEVISLDI